MSHAKWLAIALALLTITTTVAIAKNYEIYFKGKDETLHLKPSQVDKPDLPATPGNTPR